MGFKDFFKKKKSEPEGPDPITDLILSKLKVGYYVDYDLKSWEVTAYNIYDWGSGDFSYEWQLKTSDDSIFLEKEEDDEVYWSISRKVAFGRLGSQIKDHIIEHENPPEEIAFEGTTYYMEESGGGHFLKDGKSPGQQLLKWDYEDDSGEKLLSIEQWGETDFEASCGNSVEEYQFSNILPA